MELCFLLSDVPAGHGHQLIQSITDSSHSVIAFVKNFEDVSNFQNEFVTWIVLDVKRNSDTVSKFLRTIPTPNYIVNFIGPDFLRDTLQAFQSFGVSFKERERGLSELTLEGISGDADGEECRIFVNVVENRSELKKTSKVISKKVGKLVKGAKKKLSTLTQDDDDSSEENAPLLHHDPRRRHRISSELDNEGFLAIVRRLFFLCCPCFAKASESEYCFRNQQELRVQMYSEQLAEVQKAIKKIHETSLTKWNATVQELRRKESQRTEELVAKIDALSRQEERELTDVKEKQNANTRNSLSSVLSEDVIRKIEQSRSRQTKGTVKYDVDRAYREGQTLISKQVAIEKAQLYEKHYYKLVEEQLRKLSDIQCKYQKKTLTLQRRYFNNRT